MAKYPAFLFVLVFQSTVCIVFDPENPLWVNELFPADLSSNFAINITNNHPRWKDVRREILEAHAEVCGTSRLCNATSFGPQYSSHERCSVCDTCFCDDPCTQFGDCCLDKIIDDTLVERYVNETVPETEPTYVECADLRLKGIEQLELKKLAVQRLISRCPENMKNSSLRSECEDAMPFNKNMYRPDLEPNHVDPNNWPIASTKSLLFYKNLACAKCHNDSEENSTILWSLTLSCLETPDLPVSAAPFDFLSLFLRAPRCEVVFTSPLGMEPRPCYIPNEARPKVINDCNVTGERFQYDDILWRSCNLFTTFAKFDEHGYANAFCFRCQKDQKEEIKPSCLLRASLPFFVVLSPHAIESTFQAQASFSCRCRNNYIFNPYKKNCRKVHCATGRMLVDDACMSTVSSGNGQGYSLSLSLTSPWMERDSYNDSYPPNADVFLEVAKRLKEYFYEKLGYDIEQDNYIGFKTFMAHTAQVTELVQNFTIHFYAEIEILYPQNQEDIEKRLLSLCNESWIFHLPNTSMGLNLAPSIKPRPNKALVGGLTVDEVLTSYYIDKYGKNRTEYFTLFVSRFVRFGASLDDGGFDEEAMIHTEVKNTLICPHFIYNMTNTTEIKLETDNQRQWPYQVEMLRHVDTGIRLSQADFSYTDHGVVVICIDQIQDKMKSDYEDDRGGIDGVDMFGMGLVVTSHICLGISALCLILTLTTYCLFPVLRTLPGKSTMCLVTTLLLTITLFNAGGFVQESSVECQSIGVATHFFLLSTFVWMLLCSAHMYIVFNNIMEHPAATKDDTTRKFKAYITLSIAIPALIVTATVVANCYLTDSSNSTFDDKLPNATKNDPEEIESVFNRCQSKSKVRIGYGHGICYLSNKLSLLIAGVLPIVAMCAANLVIFTLTLLAFRRLSVQEKAARHEARSHLLIYLKLSTLTGINWLPCTAAAFVSSPVVWYFFLIMCGLQGFYVFLSFVCNKRVLALYKQSFKAYSTDSGSSSRNKGESQINNITKSLEKYLETHSSKSDVQGLEMRTHTD